MGKITNPTLDLIENRASTRKFIEEPLTDDEKVAIVNAAFRAPNACNLMSYTILEIEDQDTKEKLAVLCDNQPWIAKAPMMLLFVADYQKWVDLYEYAKVEELDVDHREPGINELILGIWDALIAAQNSAVAAESMGIGTCYIGDVIENGEQVAELLDLPRYTFPIVILVYGRPNKEITPRPRVTEYRLQKDRYHRLTDEQMQAQLDEMGALFSPHGHKPPASDYAQATYLEKHTSDFFREMERSVNWWIDRWTKGAE